MNMNEQNINSKIILFSCFLFLLMAIHIVGIVEMRETQVSTEITAMSAFNG